MSGSHWKLQRFSTQPSSRPLKVTLFLLMFLLVGLSTFCWFYQIDRTVMAEGEVVSSDGEKTVVAPGTGTLQEIEVAVGDAVVKNQTLGRIQIPFISHADFEEILRTLNNHYRNLEKYASSSKKNENFPTWTPIRSDNPTLMNILTKTENASVAYEIADRKAKFFQSKSLINLNAQISKLRKKLELLKNSKQVKYLTAAIDEQEEKILSLENQKQAVFEEMDLNFVQVRTESLAKIRSLYVEAYELFDNYRIRASADGVVSQMHVQTNQFLNKDQPILSTISEESKLEVKLQVNSVRVSKIEPGQKVRIRIDAFPYLRFGYFGGNVRLMDRSSGTGQSFMVRTTLEDPELPSRFPAGKIKILPGMKVKAYIKTRRVSIADLIFEKVFTNDDL